MSTHIFDDLEGINYGYVDAIMFLFLSGCKRSKYVFDMRLDWILKAFFGNVLI